MANACIAYDNLADAGTITVSGALANAPAANLQNPHVGVKCRVNATSMAIVIDLLSSVSVSTVALMGVSGANPAFRVRHNTSDATGATGDAFDTGSISGTPYFSSTYGQFVYLRSSAAAGRYLRIDISEAGVDYIEAGRVLAGPRTQFAINFKAPWSMPIVNRSQNTEGIGGQSFIDLRRGYRKQRASFEAVSESERTGFLEDLRMAIVNNGHKDMLWIPDPDSTNLSRDCLWGYLEDGPSLSQDLYVVPAVYSAELSFRQRL